MVNVTKADKAGKNASKRIYMDFASRIAVAEGNDKKTLIEEAHLKAIAAAQKESPKIDITGVKNQLGSTIRTWRQKNPPSLSSTKLTEEKKDGDIGAEGIGNGESLEEIINEEPKFGPEVEKEIKRRIAVAEKEFQDKDKPASTMPPQTVVIKKEKIPPEAVQAAKQHYVTQLMTTFDAIVEKVFLDDYRRALFSVWREQHKFEGDLGDFMIHAFDEFFKLRGVDLQYSETKPILYH